MKFIITDKNWKELQSKYKSFIADFYKIITAQGPLLSPIITVVLSLPPKFHPRLSYKACWLSGMSPFPQKRHNLSCVRQFSFSSLKIAPLVTLTSTIVCQKQRRSATCYKMLSEPGLCNSVSVYSFNVEFIQWTISMIAAPFLCNSTCCEK